MVSLDYNLQRRSRMAEKLISVESSKKEAIDKFSYVSWIIALILFILAATCKYFEIQLDATDLVLLGAIIGLILAPFANKIKFWGIEFERYMYISMLKLHLHGLTAPASRRYRATLTEAEPSVFNS